MVPTPETTSNQEWIDLFCGFLQQIGLEVKATTLTQPTFLPGVEIEDGVLLYDPEKLLYPGDLLHEAGHLALAPAAQRPILNGNVAEMDPGRMGDEMAVMLWTFAAARHLDIPLEIIFHEHGYKGQNDWLMENYSAGTYIGLPLLKWMGMTDEQFPAMLRWLRE